MGATHPKPNRQFPACERIDMRPLVRIIALPIACAAAFTSVVVPASAVWVHVEAQGDVTGGGTAIATDYIPIGTTVTASIDFDIGTGLFSDFPGPILTFISGTASWNDGTARVFTPSGVRGFTSASGPTGGNRVTPLFVLGTGPDINGSAASVLKIGFDVGMIDFFGSTTPVSDHILGSSVAELELAVRKGSTTSDAFFDATVSGTITQGPLLPSALIDTEGNWFVSTVGFLPANDPQAHFQLETQVVDEVVEDLEPFDLVFDVREIEAFSFREIAIDKVMRNSTDVNLSQVRFTLGTGTGSEFVASDENDDLYFLIKPEPLEETGAFPDLVLDDNTRPNTLTFNGSLDPAELASFWMGVHVPDNFDQPFRRTTFTLRQEVVPEPNSWVLLVLPFAFGWLRRRRPTARAV